MDLKERFATIVIGLLLIVPLSKIGCFSNSKPTPEPIKMPDPSPLILETERDIEKVQEGLTDTTKNIEDNARKGFEETPEVSKPLLTPFWQSILQSAGIQKKLITDLDSTKQRLAKAESESNKLKEALASETAQKLKERKAKEDALSSVTQEARKKYFAISTWCFFGMLGCIALSIFSKGNKIFVYGSLVLAAGMAICIFLAQSIQLIPWIVGGLSLILIALTVWKFVIDLKEDKEKQEAIDQVVETSEAQKPFMLEEGRKQFFGDGPKPGLVRTIQTPKTRQKVSEARQRLSNLAPPVRQTVSADSDAKKLVLVNPESVEKVSKNNSTNFQDPNEIKHSGDAVPKTLDRLQIPKDKGFGGVRLQSGKFNSTVIFT